MSDDFCEPCFEGADLIDRIRQKIIDIKNDPSLEEIIYFLNECLKYLENDLPQELANELYSAIFTFFTEFTQELMPIFNDIFKKARKNANYIYMSSLLLSHLSYTDPNINIPDYQSFINDVINEISSQITNQTEKLIIFGQEIAPQFHESMILNTALSSNLTEIVSSNILNYIFFHFWRKSDKKFNLLLLRIIKSGLNTILPQTQSSNEEIHEFLSKKDDQIFLKMSKESFSVIKSAIIYIKNESNVQINGLNEQTIFQFAAVISVLLRFLTKTNNYEFSNPLEINLFQNAARLSKNNNSSDMTNLINLILTKWPIFNLTNFVSSQKTLDFLDILIEQLINGEYKADKFILLNLYFKSFNKIEPDNSYQLSNLFSFILSNFKEEEFKNFVCRSVNLKYVNQELVRNQFQNLKSEEEAIQKVYFFSEICFNQPLIIKTIQLSQLLMKAFDQQIQNKKYNNAMLICNFLKRNNFEDEIYKIQEMNNLPLIIKLNLFDKKHIENEEIEIDELLFNILTVDDLKDLKYLLSKLFKVMMKDEDNLHCYLSYLVSQQNCSFDIKDYYTMFSNEYNQYHDMFLKVTNELFTYISAKKILVVQYNFKLENFKISKFGYSIVSKVFASLKENPVHNYQAFLCLKSIACTVPILFNSNIQLIFDSILKPFNNLYLLFEDHKNDEKNLLLAKTAYASLSFLLSTFHSSLVLDNFVRWLFVNIENFSNSQIFGFVYILRCLSKENNVFYSFIPSDYKKYDFFNKVAKFLNRKITEGPYFEKRYQQNLLGLLERVFYGFSTFSPYVIIQNEMLSEIENKFTYFYSNVFSSFIQYGHFYIDPIDRRVSSFIELIKTIEEFSINFISQNRKFNEQQFQMFCEELPNNKEYIVSMDDKKLTKPVSIRMAKYLTLKPILIYGTFLFRDDNVYSQKNGHLFMEAVNKLREFQKQALENPQDEDDSDVEKLNIIDYFTPLICQPEFIKSFVNQMIKPETNIDYLSEILYYMDMYPLFIKKPLELFGLKIMELAGNPSVLCDIFETFNQLALYRYCNESFFDLCGNNLIKVVLLPECRNDAILLNEIARFLISLNLKLPIRVTHLINFLILMNSDELTLQAIKLCRHFDITELGYISDSLLNILDQKCLQTENYNSVLLTEIANNVPSIFKYRKVEIFSILTKEFEKHSNYTYGSFNEKKSFNLICLFLNAIAPNRFDSTTVSNIIDSTSTKIPSFIKEIQPDFWTLYEQNMELINEKLMNDPFLLDKKLRFLLNYPEIVNFKVRSSYFKKKMKSRIHRKQLLFDIDFNNILKTSYQALHDQPPEVLLNDFRIYDLNSEAVDLGGVKRTWFTLLARELFNQNYGIFDCSKNMRGYKPSRNSFIHENHLEYFKFAGMFIARALIEGVSIDAHLTSSFCKQILHRKTNLKDLEDIDDDMYRSLQMILESDANELYLTFSIDIDDFGTIKTIDLKENGSEIPVTNENKVEFVNLRTDYILNVQIKEQISAFNSGFDSLIPHEFLRIFTPNELDLLICGVPSIDVNDFKANMTYIYPYDEKTPVVKLFFEVIQNWENEDLTMLLLFMTGSSRVPINGFKEFAEISGQSLKIGPGGKRENWPQAHTCFNELDLPEYQTKEELETQLRRSMEYNNSFGIL